MKTIEINRLRVATVMFALLCLALPVNVMAQDAGTLGYNESKYNDDNHAFIIKRLKQRVQLREKSINKQVQQLLINLPNEEKLYDETYVRVSLGVQEDTTEDGKPEINLVYGISYNCHHFEGTEDDYPAGQYPWNTSNSCRVICNITKKVIEDDLADLFAAGSLVTTTIGSSADAQEVTNIRYNGEYGEFRYMPAVFNDENVRISVNQAEGITSNAQLAYIRAQGVRYFLDSETALKGMQHQYLFNIRCFDAMGSHYRRSSLTMVVHGAFDAEARTMLAALMNDEYVDFNIPVNQENANSKTYALIIADEEYMAPLPNCDFASNDGDVMAEYFVKTLGIPQRHLRVLHNAGKEEIQNEGIHWLKDIIKAQKGQVHIIIYYAGHGINNTKFAPYLLPSDVVVDRIRAFRSKTGVLPEGIMLKGGDMEKVLAQGISINDLAGYFNKVEALSYTFIIDASCNGVQRSGKEFFQTEKETKRYRAPRLRNDVVVFMGADGDKTAYSFIDQHHGFFTYYILKELKATRGEITFKDLFNNVTTNQKYESSLQGKLQEPSIIIGGELGEGWGDRTFLNN